MNRSKVQWTVRYTFLNVAYFAAFCTVHAYAAVYLLSKGFSNTEVGVLLAVANVQSDKRRDPRSFWYIDHAYYRKRGVCSRSSNCNYRHDKITA